MKAEGTGARKRPTLDVNRQMIKGEAQMLRWQPLVRVPAGMAHSEARPFNSVLPPVP